MSGLLDTVAKWLFYGGLVVLLGAVGLLIFTYQAFAGGSPPGPMEQGLNNARLFSNLALAGGIATIVGSAYLFWGEEILGALQLIVSAILYTAPLYLPSMVQSAQPSEPSGVALAGIQTAGLVMGVLSICVLIADVITRVRQRATLGSKADQLKFGKGVREERDRQNVFMGKCWQLPFCRKFIRERCPIYHAKRTCWKERVGCMCEEEVIRKAMEDRPIPKDLVASAKFIPYNQRLPMAAKMERCRQCVIYNEHQKHKYRLILPLVLLTYVASYIIFREPLLAGTGALIDNLDKVIASITFRPGGGVANTISQSQVPFKELFLICMLVVALAYTLQVVEYLIFKLKL